MTVPSLITVEYLWQILGRGAFLRPTPPPPHPPPIIKQPQKSLYWIALRLHKQYNVNAYYSRCFNTSLAVEVVNTLLNMIGIPFFQWKYLQLYNNYLSCSYISLLLVISARNYRPRFFCVFVFLWWLYL